MNRQQMAQGAVQPTVAAEDRPPNVSLKNPGEEIYGLVLRTEYDFPMNDTNDDGTPRHGSIAEIHDEQRGPITFWVTNIQLYTGFVKGVNQLNRPVQTGDMVYVRREGTTDLGGKKRTNNYAINVAIGQPPAQQQNAPQQVPAPQQNGYQQPPQPSPQQQWQQPAPQQWQQPQPQQQPAQQPQDVPF